MRNQAQPFLRVGLPEGATLLSAEVAGAAVKPAQGADGLRIPLLRPGFRPQGPYAVSFVYLHAGPAFAEKGDASLTLARVDLPVAWLEWEMLLPDRMEASRFDGTAFPRELMPVASPMAASFGVAESVTVIPGDKVRRGRQAGQQRAVAERAEPAEARRRRPARAPRRPARRPVAHLRASAGDGRGDAGGVPLQVEEIATVAIPELQPMLCSELLTMLARADTTIVAGTTLRAVQRILAAGLIAVFVALSALHVFWAAGGRAGGAVGVPRQSGEALFTPSPLGTLAVAVALVAAAASVAAAAGWFGAGRPWRAGRVLTVALAVIFLLRAVGDFRYVGFFKSIGDEPFRSWDTWLFSPLCLAIALPKDRGEKPGATTTFGADDQERGLGAVADVVDRAAEEDVADQAMAVRRHRDQVALRFLGQPEDLARRIAEGEHRGHRQPVALPHLDGGALEIRAIVAHLLRLDQLQSIVVARRPAVGDVDEQHLGLRQRARARRRAAAATRRPWCDRGRPGCVDTCRRLRPLRRRRWRCATTRG